MAHTLFDFTNGKILTNINYEKENEEYQIRKIICNDDNTLNKIYYQQMDNITVIRDDKLCGGTKSRFVHDIINEYPTYNKFVYFSPLYGAAQIALAWGTNKYNKINQTNKQAIIFIENQINYRYPFMKIAEEYGAIYYYGSHKQMIDYVKNNPDAMLVPPGMDLPIVQEKIRMLGDLMNFIMHADLEHSYEQFKDQVWQKNIMLSVLLGVFLMILVMLSDMNIINHLMILLKTNINLPLIAQFITMQKHGLMFRKIIRKKYYFGM
jgi:hypothetical protein